MVKSSNEIDRVLEGKKLIGTAEYSFDELGKIKPKSTLTAEECKQLVQEAIVWREKNERQQK